MLDKDLKEAAGCVQDHILKKAKFNFTEDMVAALISFVQSVPCDMVQKYTKNNKIAANATVETVQAFFVGAITQADANRPASNELSARRDAEKTLFGISA